MKAQAMRPNFIPTVSRKEKEAEGKGASDEEIALSTLSDTKGWQVLKEFIEGLLRDLENINTTAIAKGLTFEEIGKNTVVVSMAKEVVNRIVTKVADAKEACEKINE